MIAAQDLMLGDIVDVHRSECVADDGRYMEWNEYGKIVCITDCYITIKYIGREDDYGLEDIEEKDIEPIPLTAEILEKNGWSYNNEDAKYAAETWVGNGLMLQENGVGYRIVVVSDYDDEDTNDTQFVITYIHQLQHALRLAGIEKTIEL